jgi:bifunctional UDP-N-acetylglucosamine pyrophosphorylase/glucosamine-1-phosphate N-acetyltransferase
MKNQAIAAILLAAGQGTRMKSSRPKVMHALAGRPMIQHLTDMLEGLKVEKSVVVIGPDMQVVSERLAPIATVVQKDRLGTAHAVAQAGPLLKDFDGTVLVLYGDTPLITAETVKRMLDRRAKSPSPSVVVLGFRPADPGEYGRLVTGPEGLRAIVEHKDATIEQRAITLCNSGVMALDGRILWELLEQIGNDNAKGEYYLTDIVGLAVRQGLIADYVEAEAEELLGVNSRAELAAAEMVVQNRLRKKIMAGGATLTDPQSVYFAWDTKIGQDVVIGQNVVFGPGVTVADDVEIRPFCHLEGVSIEARAQIGPFARLRPGAQIAAGAHVGNFVEIKNATVEQGAKVNHLAYIGDARIGAAANIGAGTITCNYDGFGKYHTDIGAGAFIGSNSALVAPVKVGDGAIVGAGSVITKDVAEGALAVGRSSQMELPGWADRFRSKKKAEKKGK